MSTEMLNYGLENVCDCTLKVDRSIFTEQHAKATLDFFLWDYDDEEDPVTEVLKKYALQIMAVATEHNASSREEVMRIWARSIEGYGPIDGTIGIDLINVTPIDWHDHYFNLEIRELG